MNVVQRSWSDAVYDDTVLGFCHIGNLQNLPADTTENIRPKFESSSIHFIGHAPDRKHRLSSSQRWERRKGL